MNASLWNTLDAFSHGHCPAAVLAEWRQLAGEDFEAGGAFLRPTQRLAETYPCLHIPPCGCRHECVEYDEGKYLARCDCEMSNCRAPRLVPLDLVVRELDVAGFGGAVARALGFDPVDGRA